jgi:hypothetical protein
MNKFIDVVMTKHTIKLNKQTDDNCCNMIDFLKQNVKLKIGYGNKLIKMILINVCYDYLLLIFL